MKHYDLKNFILKAINMTTGRREVSSSLIFLSDQSSQYVDISMIYSVFIFLCKINKMFHYFHI
jgi:hypothetical protein